jgi:hypothetical protein
MTPQKARFRLHAALATAVLAALLLAAGCGSQGPSPRAKLIARADPICKGLNARRAAADTQVGAVNSVSALPKVARVAPGLAAYERSAIAELRTLAAPSSLSDSWQKILAGTELLAAHTAKLGVEAQAHDLKGVEALIHSDQQKERELITIATTAGFAHCGRNG